MYFHTSQKEEVKLQKKKRTDIVISQPFDQHSQPNNQLKININNNKKQIIKKKQNQKKKKKSKKKNQKRKFKNENQEKENQNWILEINIGSVLKKNFHNFIIIFDNSKVKSGHSHLKKKVLKMEKEKKKKKRNL